MDSPTKQGNGEPPDVVGRRSTRLSMIIPITVHGVDVNGQAFKENTWTIGVNKQGAKIATFHPLPSGTQISIVNPVLGRTARARVIWVGEKRFPEDPYEVGVELVEAQNVWGINFPPEDWQRGIAAAAASRAAEKGTAAAPAPAEPAALETPLPGADLRAGGAPAEKSSEPAAQPDKFNEFNLALAALSRFAQQAGEPTEARADTSQPTVLKISRDLEAQARTILHEVSARLKELEEKATALSLLKEQVDRAADQWRASREEAGALIINVQELRRSWEAEVEKTRRELQEASRRELESLSQKYGEKLNKEIESAISKLTEETRKSVQADASASVEASRKEAAAHLTKLAEDYLSKIASAATPKVTEAPEELERSLRGKVEKALEESGGQILRHLTESLEERARSAEASLQEKLQATIEEALSNATSKVQQASQQEVREASQVIAQRLDWAVNSLNASTETSVAKFQSAFQKVQTEFKAKAEAFPNELASSSTPALEDFHRRAEGLISDLKTELLKTLGQFQEKTSRELSEQLQKTAEGLLESSGQQLHKQADDVLEMISEELNASSLRVIEETKKQLTEAGQSTRDALAEQAKVTEQMLKDFHSIQIASGKAFVDATEKQLRNTIRSILDSLTGEARALSEECHGQLQKTFQEFRENSLRKFETEIAGAREKELDAIRQQLQQEAVALEGQAVAQLKSVSEGVVKEATDAVYKQVGVGAVVLRDWVEQARTQLESSFEKSTTTLQKQVGEVYKVALEKHRLELEGLLAGLHTRLEKAARILIEKERPSE